jgi:hypothetical protein
LFCDIKFGQGEINLNERKHERVVEEINIRKKHKASAVKNALVKSFDDRKSSQRCFERYAEAFCAEDWISFRFSGLGSCVVAIGAIKNDHSRKDLGDLSFKFLKRGREIELFIV